MNELLAIIAASIIGAFIIIVVIVGLGGLIEMIF